MCQFNLVFVKSSKNKKILKNNEYDCFGDNINNFSPFVKGYCNCDSFVGSMCNYSENSYIEMIKSLNKSELAKLTKIKNFMNKPNYKQLKENYIKTRNSFSNAVEKFFEPLSTYETHQINMLEKKYKGKQLQKHMENLYKDLENKIQKIENSPDFKLAQTKLNDFIEKNKLMEESTLYYLTKKDKENECFDDLDNSVENITIPEEESLVIDNVIKKLETRYEKDYNNFLEYKQLFEKLLENENYILFSCIWDEPKEMLIEKEVNIKDITIEDLASLEFNKMLKIHREQK